MKVVAYFFREIEIKNVLLNEDKNEEANHEEKHIEL